MPALTKVGVPIGTRKPPNVLVVEDDNDCVRIVRMLLEKDGYNVKAVSNGEEAFESLKDLLADVLILDVGLPGMSGYEVCRMIKADDRLKRIPIVFLTSYDSPRDYVAGQEAGGVFYISKPYDPRDLLQVVRSLAPSAGRVS